ncbi:Serine carboxypeptidase [Spironucleus salmonicida]|uniref:Serine carboxypeptidase n=1 Tax=Spironucleus salmonicida TaxID=348837 RepID=A0A9P8LWX4_9EUKA|nr:Serine carboxypeptidase [Spironucleus salmonicida]
MLILLSRIHKTFYEHGAYESNLSSIFENTFMQKLDHFNHQNDTHFEQRYFINDQHFKKNGPLVIMIGGEGEISKSFVTEPYSSYYFAQQLNGLLISLEHRFYGKSGPEFTNQDIVYLNSQQTIADYSKFIPFIKEKYNITKVVVMGGSYPGSLAAYLRAKLPHLVDAALSSSGPVKAQFNYTQYLIHAQQQLERYKPECTQGLQSAYIQVETLLNGTGKDLAALSTLLGLGAPITTVSTLDKQNILELLTDPVAGIVQYAKAGDIEGFCDGVIAAGTAENVISYLAAQAELTDLYFDQFVASLKGLNNSMRSWMWQTCSEFAYFQSAAYEGSIFSKMINLDYFVQMCHDAYFVDLGISDSVENSYKIIAEVISTTNNQVYGARIIPRDHIYYTNGEVDPWSELSINAHMTFEDGQFRPKETEYELIQGGSHCSDLYMSWGQNQPVRERQLKSLKKWLDIE